MARGSGTIPGGQYFSTSGTLAGEDLSAWQGKAVKYDSSGTVTGPGNDIVKCALAGNERPLGILANAPADTEAAEVITHGFALAYVHGSSIAPGDPLGVSSTRQGVLTKVTTNGEYVFARCMEYVNSASTDLRVRVEITHEGINSIDSASG